MIGCACSKVLINEAIAKDLKVTTDDIPFVEAQNQYGLIRSKSVAPPPTPNGRIRVVVGDSPNRPLIIAFNGGAVTLDPIMHAESTTTAWQRHIFDTITIEGTHGDAPSGDGGSVLCTAGWGIEGTPPDGWPSGLRQRS